MSTDALPVQNRPEMMRRPVNRVNRASLDSGMLVGIAIALIALVAGIAITGVSARYFFQPTGVLIVLGGTLGVMLITTPVPTLHHALQSTLSLFTAETPLNREELAEEIVWYAKLSRFEGLIAIEHVVRDVSHSFLKDALLLAMDTGERAELESALENKMRLCERQSEVSARVLEVAGGFAPTIGMLGTIVGLIDALRQFSTLAAIAPGIGAAFTSTIYGLALANLVLLPAAYRIRARAAETLDLQELMTEGALCLFNGMHPTLVRHRLDSFLDTAPVRESSLEAMERPLETPQI